MATKFGEAVRDLAKASGATVDSQMDMLAKQKLCDVVSVSEHNKPFVGVPGGYAQNAAMFLVCRMFTDAIFNQDIRTIQLIVNRIDGALPKDTEMENYQTQFSDCFNEIMQMKHVDQVKLLPEDTVMMALCKALYQLSVQDIYWDEEGQHKKKPSVEKKQERDAALRLVLERTGGRKTTPVASKDKEDLEMADWIKEISDSSSI